MAKVIGTNVAALNEFDSSIHMYCWDSPESQECLADTINQTHQNKQTMCGVQLPTNVIATSSLPAAVTGCKLLIFCMPHQYLTDTLVEIESFLEPGVIALSMIGGMGLTDESIVLISQQISNSLGIDCSVMMGASVPKDVCMQQFSEVTLGYNVMENGKTFQRLLSNSMFRVNLTNDIQGDVYIYE